eukprot:8957429-Pyramimonas_sp.AAC.1
MCSTGAGGPARSKWARGRFGFLGIISGDAWLFPKSSRACVVAPWLSRVTGRGQVAVGARARPIHSIPQ